MPSQDFPFLPMSENNCGDRATAAILAGGGADGLPAFALRQWRSGTPGGSPAAPVFITWLPGIGRFCLTVQYGRYSLRDGNWRIDTRAGLRSTQSPLEQAQLEALRVSEALRRRLARSAPVAPALVFFDMSRDRPMERLRRPERRPPAVGPGALHRQAGRGQHRPSLSPIPGAVHRPGRDIRTAGAPRPSRRGSVPHPGAEVPIRTRPLTGAGQRRQLLETGHPDRPVLRPGQDHGIA